MTTAQLIAQRVQVLPESAQQEVLDFVEFLQSRSSAGVADSEDTSWAAFSLAAAMRGMEDEASPYSLADLKE